MDFHQNLRSYGSKCRPHSSQEQPLPLPAQPSSQPATEFTRLGLSRVLPLSCTAPKTALQASQSPFSWTASAAEAFQPYIPLLSMSNSCFCQSVPHSASWKVL